MSNIIKFNRFGKVIKTSFNWKLAIIIVGIILGIIYFIRKFLKIGEKENLVEIEKQASENLASPIVSELNFSAKIFPSPVSGFFTLMIDSQDEKKFFLTIYDSNNLILIHTELSANTSEVNMSSYIKGRYKAKIQDSKCNNAIILEFEKTSSAL